MLDLIRWFGAGVIAAALMWSGGEARAAFDKPSSTWRNITGSPTQSIYSSPQAVCDWRVTLDRPGKTVCAVTPWAGHYNSSTGIQEYLCYATTTGTTCDSNNFNGATAPSENACPANSTQTSSSPDKCTCNAGYNQQGAQGSETCVLANPCVSGSDKRRLTYGTCYDVNRDGLCDADSPMAPPSTAGNFKYGSCQYAPDTSDLGIECWAQADAPTKLYCTANYKQTGDMATSQPDPLTPSATNPCPAGKSYGTVNGIGGCYASGSPSTPPPAPSTSSTTKAVTDNGNGTSTETTTTTNPDGSKTVTTTIINNTTGEQQPGTTSTTQTTLNPNAGDDGKAGKTEQAEFCRDNPNSPMCRQGTWAGSCSTTFSCTGDAVQCAQAQAAYQFACEATKRTGSTDLGEQIVAGSDPAASTLPKASNAETVNLNVAGTINQTGWLTRSCPGDETFSYIGGLTFTVPWGTYCSYLQLFANLLVAACLLAAARIIGTGA